MPLPKPFKLEKLKVKAFKSRRRSATDAVGTFEAMFNPESFNQKYEIVYGKNQGYNSTNKRVDYERSKPAELNLTLVLDGTGVDQFDLLRLGGTQTVAARVKAFLDLTFRMNGSIHEPNYLTVEWGALIFSCRLGSVDVKYTSFDRDGTPLRAELQAAFVADQEVKKRMAEENKSSPDLTHRIVVRAGDTLPLLTQRIYGTTDPYVWVAQVNGLDDFRRLTPGQELVFPPLESAGPTATTNPGAGP